MIILVIPCVLLTIFSSVVAKGEYVGKTASQLYTYEEVAGLFPPMELELGGYEKFIHPESELEHLTDIYDFRTDFPQCVGPVSNVKTCAASWAVAPTSVLSDRGCRSGSLTGGVRLSPQILLQCDYSNSGCRGGQSTKAWQFLAMKGTSTEKCIPTTLVGGVCPSKCTDNSEMTLYFSGVINHFPADNVSNIQAEIKANGPVTATMTIYEDFFYDYTEGVYTHTWGRPLTTHVVKLVGWGKEESTGVQYWIAEESMGPEWGERGFFRIRSGVNECGIESNVFAGKLEKNAFIPLVPKFPTDYYTSFTVWELGIKQGSEIWVKDNGKYNRQEAYMPGQMAIITSMAGLKDGWIVEEVRSVGTTDCVCVGPPQGYSNMLDITDVYKFSGVTWSGTDKDTKSTRHLIFEYSYKSDIQFVQYSFANAAIPGSAYPWSLYESVKKIEVTGEFSVYMPQIHDDKLFEPTCTCPEKV